MCAIHSFPLGLHFKVASDLAGQLCLLMAKYLHMSDLCWFEVKLSLHRSVLQKFEIKLTDNSAFEKNRRSNCKFLFYLFYLFDKTHFETVDLPLLFQ